MAARAYYNEIDPYAAEWLRNLIAAGHIPAGDVDERDIRDVHPDDLAGYTQCHFFAGIGIWAYALRLAGWPDDRPVWTGSCPCQPFSSAGRGDGFTDERHLWPAWHHLIRMQRPGVVFGEQVASKDGLAWLDLVQADLEGTAYASGAVDLCAAGVGAPHIRQRLWFVAERMGEPGIEGLEGQRGGHRTEEGQRETEVRPVAEAGESCGLADSADIGRVQGRERLAEAERDGATGDGFSAPSWPGGTRDGPGGLADARSERRQQNPGSALGDEKAHGAARRNGVEPHRDHEPASDEQVHGRRSTGPTNGHWRDADWLGCRDGKWRPVEASPQPMADGSAESLGRVRPEIIAQAEEAVDEAAMETEIEPASLLRNVRDALSAEAPRLWPSGGLPGLHEAPFLLSFLRQLTEQGWRFAESCPLSRPETTRVELRGLRRDGSVAGAPHQRELGGQPTGEYPDPVHFLSSLLARIAQEAWGSAYEAHAEIGFPLGRNAPARAGRLRAYGNGIVAQAAKEVILAYTDSEVAAC